MSTLRSSLDELRVEDLRFAADEGLVADLDELEHASRVIDSERARRLDEINRRGYPAVDGSLSTSAWLAHRHPMPASAAAAQLRFARALGEMPAAAEALTCGEVSAAAVGELIRAREGRENAFEAAEEALVGAARALSFGQLRSVLAYWRQAADPDLVELEEGERFARRRLHVSATLHGMVRVDGDLDPETGQTVISALRAMMDAERGLPSDATRTCGRRRSGAPTRSARSAGGGWTAPIGRPLRVNARTSS